MVALDAEVRTKWKHYVNLFPSMRVEMDMTLALNIWDALPLNMRK